MATLLSNTRQQGMDDATRDRPTPARIVRTPTKALARHVGNGLAALAFALAWTAPAGAGDAAHWVATWTASPQPTWGADFPFPTRLPPVLENQTVRQVARVSVGGNRLRIALSNAYGDAPMQIGATHVALASGLAGIVPGSDRPVTFGGSRTAVVAPGAPLLSDPIDLPVAALGRVAVSVHLPAETAIDTFHWDARQTTAIAPGDQAGAPDLQGGFTTTARLLLSAIEVDAGHPVQAVAVIGDSITDGNGASLDADTRWPDFLAARLAPRGIAVLNAGISGARLLSDRMGVNALARFDRDVLAQPHLRSVIVMLGINDISWPGTAFDPAGAAPAADGMIAGYRQLIVRARARGVRIVGATLTPFDGALAGTPLADYHDSAKDALRMQVNRWIRESGEFDAVIDLDAALRDPVHPARLRPDLDSGDHLHPGDRGNAAMANAVDVDAL